MKVFTIIAAVLVAVGNVTAIDTSLLRGGNDHAASVHSAPEEVKVVRDGCYTHDDTPTPSVLPTPAPPTPSVDYPTPAPTNSNTPVTPGPTSIAPKSTSSTPVVSSPYPTPVQTPSPGSDYPTSAPTPPVTATPKATSDYEVPSPAPVTPEPTPAPVTPAPETPEPVTPVPPTPAPVTPEPTPAPVTPEPTPSPVTPVPSPSPSFDPDQSYQRPNECLGSISATLNKPENCNLEFMVNSQGLTLYGCMRCNEKFTADILTAPYYMCGNQPICSRFYQYSGVTPNNLKCLVLAKGNKDPADCGLW